MRLLFLLLRPRRVWLPTVWGWLTLLLAGLFAAVMFGREANAFLALNEPARGRDGNGARTLIVEGWLDASDLDQALAAFRHGPYERILTTGGPIQSWNDSPEWKSYADRAASYLRRRLDSVPLTAVPAPPSAQDRSFLSAVMVREWMKASAVRADAIDVFSAGVHARRSRLVYQMAFGDGVEVGVMAARPETYDADHWWKTSNGVKTVIGEGLSLAWTKCCFWPAARGSREERWGIAPL